MKVDYLAIFAMGVTFAGTGVVFLTAVNPVVGIGLIAVGAANMAVGAAHRTEWRR